MLPPSGIKMTFYFYVGNDLASETVTASGIKVTFPFYAESDVTFDASMTCGIKVTFHFYFGKYESDVTSWHGDDLPV